MNYRCIISPLAGHDISTKQRACCARRGVRFHAAKVSSDGALRVRVKVSSFDDLAGSSQASETEARRITSGASKEAVGARHARGRPAQHPEGPPRWCLPCKYRHPSTIACWGGDAYTAVGLDLLCVFSLKLLTCLRSLIHTSP